MEKETVELFRNIVEIIRGVRSSKKLKIFGGELSKLTMAQIYVLQFLRDKDKANMGELSEHADVKMPTMTDTINRLLKADYVKRKHSDTDRRQVWISITDKGKEIIDKNREQNMNHLDLYMSKLTPKERGFLLETAKKLKAGLVEYK